MARTQNEKDRDEQIINALDLIIRKLSDINGKLEEIKNAKK